jgi:plastocyanin
MKTKNLIPMLGLTVIICAFSQLVVKAGGPVTSATNTTSTSTLRGVVKFEGTVPKPTLIKMAADPSCAKQHPTPVLNQDVAADPKGGLGNVVVFIADGLSNGTFDPPSQPVVIDQKGCMYQPHVLAMRTNQPLEVVNDDPTSHNIHPVPANNREWNKSEPPGSKAEETFQREEIAIPVKCNIHPWMRGYVAVFKHPFFAVTSKDGTFDLKNIPPGTYTIKAWHEKLGTSTQKITLGANETKAIEFVFKSGHGT